MVFVLCQNQWIQHTHFREVIPTADIHAVAAAYGLRSGLVENGNDVAAVYDAISEAVTGARSGRGPAFVECRSYRMAGHFTGDPGGYQPPEDVAYWKARDPIESCRRELMAEGLLSAQADEKLYARIHAEAESAFARACADPTPDPAEVSTGVYAELEVDPW